MLDVVTQLEGEKTSPMPGGDEQPVLTTAPRPIGVELTNATSEIIIVDDSPTHEYRLKTSGTAPDGEHEDIATLYYFTEGQDPANMPSHLLSYHEHFVTP
jgi:acyl-CoA thioesterase